MTTNTEAPRCQANVTDPGAWRSRRCERKATRDGWCGQHHPDAEKKKAEKNAAAHAEKMAGFYRGIERRKATADLLAFALSFKADLPEPMRAIVDRYEANADD